MELCAAIEVVWKQYRKMLYNKMVNFIFFFVDIEVVLTLHCSVFSTNVGYFHYLCVVMKVVFKTSQLIYL